MKRRIFCIVSLLLCMSMLLCTGVTATGTEADDYVVTYSAEEITDIEELIQLGLAQHNQARGRSAANEDELLTVQQVLKVREYADGSSEEDCVITSLGLTVAQANDKDYSASQGWSYITGYSITTTLHYTQRYTSGSGLSYTFRANRLVTTINKLSSATVSVTGGEQRFVLTQYNAPTQRISYNPSSASGTQTFTFYCPDSNFYETQGDLWGSLTYGVGGECEVTFSDGRSALLQVYASVSH